MSDDSRRASPGQDGADDPALRLFRGEKAIETATRDAPPPEVRSVIRELWLTAVATAILAGGSAWLLAIAPDPVLVATGVFLAILAPVLVVPSIVLAILLAAGSDRARRLLTWPHSDEIGADVAVLGGWWMLSRSRLRTRAARAWFHARTMERLQRR